MRRETDCEFLQRVLSDGFKHSLNEILARSFSERGCGLTVHSRAADLRKRGLDVVNWKDGTRGNGSWYRLNAGDIPSGETVGNTVSGHDTDALHRLSVTAEAGPPALSGAVHDSPAPDGAAQLRLEAPQFRRQAAS